MGYESFGNLLDPKVIIIGVFHGDEPQGEYLLRQYWEEKKASKMLLVPRLNDCNTRVNKNGVDLNRNFPTTNWELSKRDEYFGGDAPASEDETRFIIDLVEKYNPKVIMTLHAPYKVVNFDGGNKESDREIIENISKIMGYPIEESIGYPTPGSFGTWAGIERGILTITLELDESIPVEELLNPVFKVFEYLESV